MKTPKFLSKLSAVLTPRPKKKLQATARAARQVMEDYDSEEPTTKLSSAFVVVLILHIVAVGGIYAFNSIKASRRDRETASQPAQVAAPVSPKSAAPGDAPAAAPTANGGATVSARKVEAAALTPVAANFKAPVGRQYEVKAGDNLTKIAFAYSVSSADLMAANQLKEGALLRPGQLLIIPAAKTIARPAVEAPKPATTAKQVDIAPTKTTPGLYTVKKGDTLTSIARGLGVSSEELSKANKITDPKKLQLGQVLKVPRKS
jgi:LysM repeat protein